MAQFVKLNEYLVKNGSVYVGDNDARSFNINNILYFGVLSLGRTDEWFVTATLVSGKTILVNLAGTPFATKALAISAKDSFLSTLEMTYDIDSGLFE